MATIIPPILANQDDAGPAYDIVGHTGTESWWNASSTVTPATGLADGEAVFEQSRIITGLYLYPIVCTFGIIGNCAILYIFTDTVMRTSTNAYLSALAFSDIVKLVNDFLYFVTMLAMKTDPPLGQQIFGKLYPYTHFVFSLSACTSAWLTVSVAAERYFLICKISYAHLFTREKAIIVSSSLWAIAVMLSIPFALRYTTEEIPSDDPNHPESVRYEPGLTKFGSSHFFDYYNYIMNVLRSTIPWIVLIFFNGFIIHEVRKTRANRRLAARNRITTMLIVVIAFFTVFTLPDAVMSICLNEGYAESKNFHIKTAREFTDFLLVINAATNFPLYMTFNKSFRDLFWAKLCPCCPCKCDAPAPEDPQQEPSRVHRNQRAAREAGETPHAQNGGNYVAMVPVNGTHDPTPAPADRSTSTNHVASGGRSHGGESNVAVHFATIEAPPRSCVEELEKPDT